MQVGRFLRVGSKELDYGIVDPIIFCDDQFSF